MRKYSSRCLVVAIVFALFCVGCDRQRDSTAFAVLHVDGANIDVSPSSDKFPFFGNAKLPQGASVSSEQGLYTLTHPDKSTLERFFDGKISDDHLIGYKESVKQGGDDEGKKVWSTTYLWRDPVLTAEHIAKAEAMVDTRYNRPFIAIDLTDEGSERFAQFTREHKGERLAIIVDGEVRTLPVIDESVTEGRLRLTMGEEGMEYLEVFETVERLTQLIREAIGDNAVED